MKKISILIVLFMIFLGAFAQEPGNNLGKTLSEMKQKFPELRYIKTDQKGDEYEDGYPQDGIATFFYFNNGKVIEECMICQSNDGFPLDWFRSLCAEFNKKWSPSIRENTRNHKEYVFSSFSVDLIYVSENNQNTALIVYSKRDDNHSNFSSKQNQRSSVSTTRKNLPNRKLEWYEIGYTENQNDVYGLQAVGRFSAKSSPSFFGSRTYSDAFHSALQKLQKKAAKKGAKILLITYKSSMNYDFLTVNVEAIGYK
jgi:hypothetical protein